MTKNRLIFIDMIFIVGVLLIVFATDCFQGKGNLMLVFTIMFAFAACLKWHVDYYKLNKKIY